MLDEHPDNDNYGSRRMHTALTQRSVNVSERTVYRAMKAGGYIHKCRKPHSITKATTEVQEKENLIKRNFKANEPMTKLLTDITEIPCSDGKLYLSAILDCFNGEIVAFEMRDNMKKELCIDTVRQVTEKFGNLQNVILHSDRGSQYTSAEFREELKKNGIVQSLSGTGHCFDNARMESFFATLKKEKIYRIPTYKMTRDEVKTVIFRYIVVYYNRLRIHTSNPEGLSPVQYREQYEAKIVLAA
ncbi:MAG: IS3 family transposase [bacterium]|nr:IS3 family transposase [bacterium]